MLESFKSGKFNYTKLTEEEQSKRGILGRLVGIIADTKNPTRNGRRYTKDLWTNVFDNPIMQEKIKNRCCFGELGHPEDREEIDMEKIAVCLAETPKLGDDGNLYGVFDILPTPNGKILKSLCDYGCTVGVSSRGTGDLITDEEGNEAVDPDSYECECFDIVLVPAVESARMNYVTESLNTKGDNGLKKALKESIEKASSEDKKVMLNTLKELNIEIGDDNPISENIVGENGKSVLNDDEDSDETKETIDDGTKEVIKNLQESLKANKDLNSKLKALQEKLAVSDAKVSELNSEMSKYKSVTERLSRLAKSSNDNAKEAKSLREQLSKKDEEIESLRKQNTVLTEEKKRCTSDINESMSKSDESLKKLNEELDNQKKTYDKRIKAINESFAKKLDESKKQLERKTKLAEKYMSLANATMNRYIDSKALMLGIKSEEIKNKLDESFTIDDVDKVCEGLMKYNINMSRLPIDIGKCAKVKVTESVEPLKKFTDKPQAVDDDDIDDSLIKLADKQ